MLYRVRIGEDVYLGRAAEVVAFMRRAEGVPGEDATSYMEAMAERLAERLDVRGIDASDEVAFLESLRERGVVPVEVYEEPSRQRVDPEEALGEGPIAYGEGVEPGDLDI
jgi:hypothetical protein